MWQAFKIAFSMYSIIPMPKTDWKEKNMRYAMCFFPLIGAVIGAVIVFGLWGAHKLGFGSVLTAIVATVIPVIISGGIHLDGFCDTIDALSSRQSVEKKQAILKDPHCGAFAVLGIVVYFLVYVGFLSEYEWSVRSAILLGISFVLSRAWSALAVVTLKPSAGSGLLKLFSDSAQKKTVVVVSALYLALCAIFCLFLQLWGGVFICAGSILIFCYVWHTSKKQFGGYSGDLAGWFVSLNELWMLIAVIVVQKMI